MCPSDRPLADRRDAVPLDERHERALVAAHDLERVVGAALVLPHQHRARPAARRASTGTIDEYWLHTAIATTSAAVGRDARR